MPYRQLQRPLQTGQCALCGASGKTELHLGHALCGSCHEGDLGYRLAGHQFRLQELGYLHGKAGLVTDHRGMACAEPAL
jgi:hypothetical protein